MILPANPGGFARAARALSQGELVGLPTETVYGLAADARNADAVARVYALKGRPSSNPLITHITDPGQAGDYGMMNAHAQALAGRFWPGPLTLVVERKASHLASGADAGLPTIALRCPDTPWRAYIPGPLVMPSANLSGHVSPTTAEHVAAEFGDDLLVIDGGPCVQGIESTVVRVTEAGATVLRPGTVLEEEIAAVVPLTETEHVGSPGLLSKHYAPSKSVRLDVTHPREGEFLIGYGDVSGDLSLGPSLPEAARNLYAALRTADESSVSAIAIAPIPREGLGIALNDRLARAARGR